MSREFEFWEKTVEYSFVIAASGAQKLDLALPLSGKPERAAGDAIFGSKARLVLVEFKRSKSQLTSEQAIFSDYERARDALAPRDSHHHFVYPDWRPRPAESLKLVAETYFSRVACAAAIDCLARGIEPVAFRDYLDDLFSWKIPDGRSSGGQLDSLALAQVLGVSTQGSLLEAMTLQDYAPHLFPERSDEASAERSTNAHRMRGGPR